MGKELNTYRDILATDSSMSKILSADMAKVMFDNNAFTVKSLSKEWLKNLKKNLALYKKHGSFLDHFRNFGKNKAVIGVGAGPSFNNNKRVLKEIYDYNLLFDLEEQPFIIIASNKMLKPLLKMGITPHFTILIDAGEALYPQLCSGIAKKQSDKFLIAGLHTNNKILQEWDRRGNHVLFYHIGGEEESNLFRKETGEDPEFIHIEQGGNVLNTLWILTGRVLGSTVYISVGNDLSFPYETDKAKREKAFYADGDYRLNILNKRDEAKDCLGWMGFTLNDSKIQPGRSFYDLTLVGTSKQLWVYKTWMEVQVALWAKQQCFSFYNASESGILGVLAKDTSSEALKDRNNWYLMDDLYPKRWYTRSLEKAFKDFVRAKACLQGESLLVENQPVITGLH